MPELWATLAALFLVLGTVARSLTLLGVRGRWARVAVGARVVAVLCLIVALIVAPAIYQRWSSFDLERMALGLAAATLVVYLVLSWPLRVDAAAPVVDIVALTLIVTELFTEQPAGSLWGCSQRMVPFHLQGALYLLGAGGLTVAGSAGLTLAFRAGLGGRGGNLDWPRWMDLHALLKHGTLWGLVALGAGLAVSMWWAWQAEGRLTVGEPSVGWVAIAWLAAAMSLLARRTGKRWGRWTAALAVMATVIAILPPLFGIIV